MALIGTVVLAFALVFHQRSAAFRTAGDVLEGTAVRRTGRKIDARDLGDDLAAFFDIYHIAYANVQQGDLFGVVQRGPLDGRSGQLHRIEVGDGVMAPVRPTWKSTLSSRVSACSALNLKATAHRGALAVKPSRAAGCNY